MLKKIIVFGGGLGLALPPQRVRGRLLAPLRGRQPSQSLRLLRLQPLGLVLRLREARALPELVQGLGAGVVLGGEGARGQVDLV